MIKVKCLIGGDMPSEIKGWCGRILKIDLSTPGITELETMAYAGRFLGGYLTQQEIGPELFKVGPRELRAPCGFLRSWQHRGNFLRIYMYAQITSNKGANIGSTVQELVIDMDILRQRTGTK